MYLGSLVLTGLLTCFALFAVRKKNQLITCFLIANGLGIYGKVVCLGGMCLAMLQLRFGSGGWVGMGYAQRENMGEPGDLCSMQ